MITEDVQSVTLARLFVHVMLTMECGGIYHHKIIIKHVVIAQPYKSLIGSARFHWKLSITTKTCDAIRTVG